MEKSYKNTDVFPYTVIDLARYLMEQVMRIKEDKVEKILNERYNKSLRSPLAKDKK